MSERRPHPQMDGFTDLVEIGSGGFSIVYAATQTSLTRRVAIKVLNMSDGDARQFQREARVFGILSGMPNIVQAHQIVMTADGRPGLVMTLMESSLSERISRTSAIPLTRIRMWFQQLTTALDRAHQVGIFHRDVKPQNVLLSRFDDAHLADFGIAALPSVAPGTATIQSLSPPYAPPERFTGEDAPPVAGDIYSLGSTAYCAITGRAPFGTTDDGGIAGLTHRVTTLLPPAHPRLPETVHRVLLRAMAKDPLDRHASAAGFARDLERAFDEAGVSEAPSAAGAPSTGAPVEDRQDHSGWWLDGAAGPQRNEDPPPGPRPDPWWSQ